VKAERKGLSKGKKGVILNTFLFLLLTFLLIFTVFVIIAPSLTAFYTIWETTQTQIEAGVYGSVTNETSAMIETNKSIKSILPYAVIVSFILTVLIYGAMTEIQKGG
jgi:uncharacterized membrane protein